MIRTRLGLIRRACVAGRMCEKYAALAAGTSNPMGKALNYQFAEMWSIIAFRYAIIAATMPVKTPAPRKPR